MGVHFKQKAVNDKTKLKQIQRKQYILLTKIRTTIQLKLSKHYSADPRTYKTRLIPYKGQYFFSFTGSIRIPRRRDISFIETIYESSQLLVCALLHKQTMYHPPEVLIGS